MDRQVEFVLRTVEERNIKFVRLWFTDVLGYLKSFALAPAELEGAFAEGIGFDGSVIEGFSRVYESDAVARPDPSTFQILPRLDERGYQYSARIFCDIYLPDGTPAISDPRNVLKKQLNKTAELGFSSYIHPEIEFFLLKKLPKPGKIPIPADYGGYFDQTTNEKAPFFRKTLVESLESMGISVEFTHHDTAPGQQEVDLRYADALSMADNIMTLRYLVKEIAIHNGVYATFMPKPFSKYAGSGMHTHMSLFEGDTNAFYDGDDENQLSKIGKAFIAGILTHAKEITAVTNQWVNSYKRLAFGGEAPNTVSWGIANRSALIRVPLYTPNKPSSRRVEIRTLDSACNPYLAYSVLLAAGLKGVTENYELPQASEDNIWQLTELERKSLGYEELPTNLSEALTAMERSELVAETLGEHVFDYFLKNKRLEWSEYRAKVTPYELETYLTL